LQLFIDRKKTGWFGNGDVARVRRRGENSTSSKYVTIYLANMGEIRNSCPLLVENGRGVAT